MPNRSGFQLTSSKLPAGTKVTVNELLDLLPSLLEVQLNNGYSTFRTGSVAPSTNEGPWLKNGVEWWVWSNAHGAYVPLILNSTVRNSYWTPPGTGAPTPTPSDGEIWFEVDGGTRVIRMNVYYNGGWRLLTRDYIDQMNYCYPIGSVYMNYNNGTNPAILLGMFWSGWSQITDCYLAAYGGGIGYQGPHGGYTQSLGVNNIPGHTHSWSGSVSIGAVGDHRHINTTEGAVPHVTGPQNVLNADSGGGPKARVIGDNMYTQYAGGHTHTASVSGSCGYEGSGSSFDIKPKYYGLYVWARTS